MAVTAERLMYQCAEITRIARGRGTGLQPRARHRCSGCAQARSLGSHAPGTLPSLARRSSSHLSASNLNYVDELPCDGRLAFTVGMSSSAKNHQRS